MPNSNRLLAVLTATTLSLTVAAAATAQSTTTRDTTRTQALASQPRSAAAAETRYTLVEVNGKALPVEIEKESSCSEEVTAGTLMLREDSHWRLETTVRETCGDRRKMDQDDEDGTYRAEGATIHFLDDDGNPNDADRNPDGEIDLDELVQGTRADGGTMTVRLADQKTVLRFRRQGP